MENSGQLWTLFCEDMNMHDDLSMECCDLCQGQ